MNLSTSPLCLLIRQTKYNDDDDEEPFHNHLSLDSSLERTRLQGQVQVPFKKWQVIGKYMRTQNRRRSTVINVILLTKHGSIDRLHANIRLVRAVACHLRLSTRIVVCLPP